MSPGSDYMTDERQHEANLANSSKSTGPKDTSNTRLNATRHGILSSEVVSRDGNVGEDESVFNEMLFPCTFKIF